ncbi:hypothetical protein LN050_09775 [Comamonadaceae bacterium M7527]|nr:hypothetical protein LN050_09775 [Comamonadaceae bacterium M7527]
MSRQIVTPQLLIGSLLAACLACANSAWAQADTPLRVLEKELGIPYGGVVEVQAGTAATVQPGVSGPLAQTAATAAEPNQQEANADTAQPATAPTPEAQQQARLDAMRALVGVPTAEPEPSKAGQQADPQAEPTDPFEQQLAAIRKALVDEALKGPTRVVSTAWVDQEGRLHEDMEVTNGMKVRGVRVLDYLDNGKNNIVARIATEQQQAETPQTRTCAAPEDPRWAQHVSFISELGPGIRGEDMHYAAEILGVWRNTWVAVANSQAQRWRQSVHTPSQLDAYQAALQGESNAQMGDWQLRLVVRAAPPAPPAAAANVGQLGQAVAPEPAKVTDWQVDIALTKRGQTQPIMRDTQRLSWSVAELGLVPPDVPQALIEQIRQASATGVLALNEQMACEPIQFSLMSQDGADLVISGGSHNGLRVGDRLVLVDSRELPKRVLHAGVVKRLALAQVAQLGMGQSTVRQVAGPALPASADSAWVAMPY